MSNQLIDSLQEMQIRFCFHIQRGRAKGRRMQPCPGFRGDDRFAEQMPCRCCPARIRKLPPHQQRCLTLAFGKIFVPIAEQRDGRKAISLRAEQSVMLRGP